MIIDVTTKAKPPTANEGKPSRRPKDQMEGAKKGEKRVKGEKGRERERKKNRRKNKAHKNSGIKNSFKK